MLHEVGEVIDAKDHRALSTRGRRRGTGKEMRKEREVDSCDDDDTQ